MKMRIILFAVVVLIVTGCGSKTGPIHDETEDVIDTAEVPATLPALPVDRIQQIMVVEPSTGNTIGVLTEKNQIQSFSDAIAGAEIATGEIIAIGENFEFVVESGSSPRRFSYWNGPHLKMIYDQNTNYFLSDEAVDAIDRLISEVASVESDREPLLGDESKYEGEELEIVKVIHQSVRFQNEGDEDSYMALLATNSGLNFPSGKVRHIEILEIAPNQTNENSVVVTVRIRLEGDVDVYSDGFYVLNKEGAAWKILDKD